MLVDGKIIATMFYLRVTPRKGVDAAKTGNREIEWRRCGVKGPKEKTWTAMMRVNDLEDHQ